MGRCFVPTGFKFGPIPPLSQHYVLLTAERASMAPFCKHLRGSELLDMPAEQFLASLRFEQRGELDQLGTAMSRNSSSYDIDTSTKIYSDSDNPCYQYAHNFL